MNAIEMKHVTKSYPEFTLKDMSLSLPSGCILGLVGENGAGKSTTIRLLLNGISRDSGEITILGRDNRSREFVQTKEEIGIVLDEAYYPEVLSAGTVSKMMQHTYKSWQQDTFMKYLERFSISDKKQFKEYSRGMKMKFAIAVALSHRPRLLILDEATSGLDPIVRDEILEIFNEFTRQEDHSVLISSHITSDLEKISDYIAFLHQGRLLFCEEKDRLMEEYGIVHVTSKNLSDVPPDAIVARREGKYATELLVKRALLLESIEVEKAGIEDIMLFLAKKGDVH